MLRVVLEVQAEDLGLGDAPHPLRPADQRLGPLRRRDDAHDLAEPERHDREVVPAQAEHRGADQQTDARGQQRDDPHRHEEVQVGGQRRRRRAGRRVQEGAGEHAGRVGAEREEGHVAEVEQARVPDHDVQTETEQHVDHHLPEHLGDHGAQQERQDRQDRQDRHQQPEPGGRRLLHALADPFARAALVAVPGRVRPGRDHEHDDAAEERQPAPARGTASRASNPSSTNTIGTIRWRRPNRITARTPAVTGRRIATGAVRAKPPTTPPTTHRPIRIGQAGRHALVERQELDQRLGDGDEDLADPVDAEPVGEPDRHGEDRPAHERGHRPHGEPAPQLDRPALPGDDPRAGHGERGDERRGDDQHPAERDLLPHQLEVGELRVQADERDVDRTGAAEQTGADDRARRDLAHHTFSASLDPSRPPGRKIRTRTRTRNVNASFSWNEEGIP